MQNRKSNKEAVQLVTSGDRLASWPIGTSPRESQGLFVRGRTHCFGPNLTADRARSFSDSTSRLRGSAVVTNDRISALADAVTSSTARSNASSFALDGLVNPQIFLTNWSDASRISASVAGGSKLNSVLMFLHMAALVSPVGQGNLAVT